MLTPDPDWLAAPAPKRRGLGTLLLGTLFCVAGAASAYRYLAFPRGVPAAPVSVAAPVALPRAPEAPDPEVSPPTRLALDTVPSAAPVGPRRRLPPPAVPSHGTEAKWIRAGNRALTRHQFSGALALFHRAVKANPQSADGWYGVALSDYELSRDEGAAQATAQALLADPTHAMANLLAGFLSQTRGEPHKARAYYARYLAQAPDGAYAAEVVSVMDQLPEPPQTPSGAQTGAPLGVLANAR